MSVRAHRTGWPFAGATLIGCLMAAPAMAAPFCIVSPIHGLLGPHGARVTMRVSGSDRACGTSLWVQDGLIPFTRLEQLRAPRHGDLTLNDPTRFAYHPEPAYRGRDSFDIIAYGNTSDGTAVTGKLHVAVSVSQPR